MRIPSPPCPCEVCGATHPHFVSGSPISTHGAGRPTRCGPQDRFKMHMTPGEMESMIYGPMWKKMYPNLPCRPVASHPHTNGVRVGMPATTPAHGFGLIGKKMSPLTVVLAALAVIAILGGAVGTAA